MVDPLVFESMKPYYCEFYANSASNSHVMGWIAESAVSEATTQIANLINAEPNEIVFTSGSTESNNTVIKGLKLSNKDHVIISNIEHKCVLNAAYYLSSIRGVELCTIQCDKKGLVDPLKFEQAIRPNTKLASIMLGNNEIHSVNDIKQISKICKEKNVLLHVDATQAVAKINVDVKQLDVDFLSLSSHKFYGPKGIGVLYIKGGTKYRQLEPLMHGGSQQGGLRGGTLAVPLIVGMGKASELAKDHLEKGEEFRLRQLAGYFFRKIQDEINDLVLNGPSIENRLPGCLSITFPNVDIGKMQFTCHDICFSRGAACSSGELDYSYVLKALGLTTIDAAGTARFCIGRFNTMEELEYAIQSIIRAFKNQYKSKSL